MSYFISIQYPYDHLVVCLSKDTQLVQTEVISKFQALSLLLPTLEKIFADHNIKLHDIAAIGINNGPGPFNTLRSIIATANAIAFVTKTPLIACNGLELLLQEQTTENTIVILDAFGTDVYYAFANQQGYCSIHELVNLVQREYKEVTKSLHFIGNGTLKHNQILQQHFAGANINQKILFASTQALVDATYKKFMSKEINTEIFPLYFASPVIKS
ncbi:MAG: tRNA (adenosine(37)-N6)-threonylcarbamoyltransferase complex dimerization subunit type 1 TsaB [Candidatus Chromulinivorax sp.]